MKKQLPVASGQLPAKKKAPTPEQIDEHAAEYLRLQEWIAAGKEDAERLKAELVKLLGKWGEVPAGAEKSFRLLGLIYQLTASFGTSSSIDEDAVEMVRIQIALEGLPKSLFGELFIEKVSHVVAPGAQIALGKCPKNVRRLFAKVMKTKPKEPSLKVEKRKR